MILASVVLPAFGASVVPPKQVLAHVSPVFSAYGRVVEAETEKTENALELALSRVLEDRTVVGDEALAVLLGFYLGEHPGEDISCELVARGSKVLPFLEKYGSGEIRLPGVPRESLRPDKSQYRGVITRIKAGEACTREP